MNELRERREMQDLIHQQTNAMAPSNLERLLTKNWSEHRNAYKVLTEIEKYSKKEQRVNKLLGLDRYSP